MRAVCASVSSGVRVFQCASVCVCAGVGCGVFACNCAGVVDTASLSLVAVSFARKLL